MESRSRIRRPREPHESARRRQRTVPRRRRRTALDEPPRLLVLVACWLMVLARQRAAPFGIPSSLVAGPGRRALVPPPSSYRGYPDQFDDDGRRGGSSSSNNNGDGDGDDDEDGDGDGDGDDPMNWWEQAIRRASSTSSQGGGGGGGGGGMVQPVGIDGEPLEAPRDPSRIRAGFDRLFSGMPTVSEILGGAGGPDGDGDGDDDDRNAEGSSGVRPTRRRDRSGRIANSRGATDDENFAWFEEEKDQILDSYRDILDDMMDQLEEERKLDPEKVPANAEALVKSVLKEEMEREIVETREARARERLDNYAKERFAEEETKDVTGPPDPSLQKLIDESEDEYARQEASREELEEFLRYEEEAFQRAAEKSDPVQPPPGSDLDRWALDRLKEMARTREGSDAGLPVLDILEENVKILQKRLERQKQKGPIMPDTMKEWQMYRSIATRLFGASSADPADGSEHSDDREKRILEQLESWKDYVDKETSARARSGLARGPKLPFEWHESSRAWDQSTTVPDKRSRADVRKDINRMSIEALESLAEKSDPSRRENLLREIDFLKSALEGRDYLDVDEDAVGPQPTVPVDLSDMFTTSNMSQERDDVDDASHDVVHVEGSTDSSSPVTPDVAGTQTPRQPPPETPFFTDEDPPTRSRPPSTPFFSDSKDFSGVSVGDSKLGNMEEQKLNAMFRRAGVRSKEEQDVIRRQWEDFKRTEEEKRMMSGLSSRDESNDIQGSVSLKYNVSDVMLEDGDFDAEKVLATIGPRPKRSKKQEPTPRTSVESTLDEAVVRDSLYRAVSAIGGGRYKEDPDMKAKQQASFEEFLDKEEEMRRALDDVVEDVEIDLNSTFDDKQYAEEVLSTLSPRPKPKRSKTIDEGEYSDKGGVLAAEDDGGDNDLEDQEPSEAPGDLWGVMPEWLRKERVQEQKRDTGRSPGRFLGSEIDDVFDDDYYDRNMRQLHEYEQRRTGRQRRMGIDVSDVLGRRAYETDDYADYKFDDAGFRGRSRSGWGEASFAARKRDLLQYTELELTELNRLMDHKDSVYATGVSQYLPRINKPFKEFGAIFRLEGVLVETTGLQYKAWSRVAKEFNFREPTLDEVRRAAVIRPETAVREAFYWTDDFIETRKAAVAHRDALRIVFDEWRSAAGIAAPEPSKEEGEDGSLASSHDILELSSHTDTRSASEPVGIVGSSWAAWTGIAQLFGKTDPTEEECWHAASLSPEEAIVAFGWTDDANRVLEIAEAYREYVRTGSLSSDEPSTSAVRVMSSPVLLDEVAVTESHYFAWKKVAERFNFEAPDPEAALAAFVINDPVLAIRDGFGWTEDSDAIKGAANYFTKCLEELLRERLGGQFPPERGSLLEPRSTNMNAISSKANEPSAEEILDVQTKAWYTAARAHGFAIPTADIARLTVGVDGQDAVLRLLKWTDDRALASQIATTYQRSYDELMSQLLKQYGIQYKSTSAPSPAVSTLRSGPSDDDIFRLAVDAWSAVASKNGYSAPDNDQVMFAMTVGPEEAILTGFQWTDDLEEAKSILELYKTEIGVRRQRWSNGLTSSESAKTRTPEETMPPVTVSPDVSKWVKSLLDVEMQCAVVSFLERDQLDALLEYAGLSDLFARDRRVSATDGYSRESQQMLGAALRLERRPDHCVVFDSSPQASDAAHENMMQSVNIIGPFPRYELLSADSTAASFAELTAMNIRRLFGERVYDQPQLETLAAAPAKKKQPRIQTRFWDDDS